MVVLCLQNLPQNILMIPTKNTICIQIKEIMQFRVFSYTFTVL